MVKRQINQEAEFCNASCKNNKERKVEEKIYTTEELVEKAWNLMYKVIWKDKVSEQLVKIDRTMAKKIKDKEKII